MISLLIHLMVYILLTEHLIVSKVVSGFYKTKFFENQTESSLPESTSFRPHYIYTHLIFCIGSLYSPIRSYVYDHMAGKDIMKNNADRFELAKVVVNNLQNGKVWYWCGGSVNVIWFNTTWLWHTFLVFYL